MKLRAVSLTVQLLLTFVGLLIVTTVALTVVAYRSSTDNLDADARRGVRLEAESRAQTVTQLLTLRQQRAEGFLVSVESLCGEPTPTRFGWSEECVKTMTEEFRATEGSVGAELAYRGRVLRHAGSQVRWERPDPMALGRVIRIGSDQSGDHSGYVMEATRGELTLLMAFTLGEVEPFFATRPGLGRTGEVFLALGDGTFLTPPRFATTATPPGSRDLEPLGFCHEGAGSTVGLDYRGVDVIHGYAPVPALGDACVDAHIARAEALAPAEQLWRELALQGGVFVLLGALLSLAAARWIATPVRTLAESAGRLRQGEFGAGVPIDGPAEVRALGRAFEQMRTDLSAMISREQAARHEAEVANRAKDEFLAAVSHELRTPLTAILGWSRLLHDGRLDETRKRRAIDAIVRSADAQRRLIEDLLDVSRIVSHRLRLVRGATSFQQVVEQAVEQARPSASEKGITLHYRGAGPMVVFADAHRLEQVAWNLLSNAVKFTPPGGRVEVSLVQRHGAAELVVSDTGVGITSAFLPHVFEWFRQDEAGVTQGGLGLGLGIVRQIVELHGGTITAASPGTGSGSTFTVSLPLHEAVTVHAAPVHTADQAFSPLDAVRVLVVDDDEGTRDVVRALLEDAGAIVQTAASAAEARDAAFRWHPHVLVSDVRMPTEDGYMLIRTLREAELDMPAIALTAYARRQDADEAYAAGFQVHMPKPADPRRLVDTIAGLAGGSARVH